MNILEKTQYFITLFDFYEELLTQKQREYFKYYFFEDYSLAEIASIYNVTRNAIYDLLQNTYNLLETYEEKLQLVRKFNTRQKLYEEYANEQNLKLTELIKKLKEIE